MYRINKTIPIEPHILSYGIFRPSLFTERVHSSECWFHYQQFAHSMWKEIPGSLPIQIKEVGSSEERVSTFGLSLNRAVFLRIRSTYFSFTFQKWALPYQN